MPSLKEAKSLGDVDPISRDEYTVERIPKKCEIAVAAGNLKFIGGANNSRARIRQVTNLLLLVDSATIDSEIAMLPLE